MHSQIMALHTPQYCFRLEWPDKHAPPHGSVVELGFDSLDAAREWHRLIAAQLQVRARAPCARGGACAAPPPAECAAACAACVAVCLAADHARQLQAHGALRSACMLVCVCACSRMRHHAAACGTMQPHARLPLHAAAQPCSNPATYALPQALAAPPPLNGIGGGASSYGGDGRFSPDIVTSAVASPDSSLPVSSACIQSLLVIIGV